MAILLYTGVYLIYTWNTMRFKRAYMAHDVVRLLGVEIETAWKWADNGTLSSYRDGIARIYNADEIDFLAPKMRKERLRGVSPLPANWKELKKRFK